MTSLFRARQRAEEFAALVDGTPSVRPTAGAQTERLVQVAQMLRTKGEGDSLATPRESFSLDLRERLVTEAATVLTPQNTGLALPHRTRGKRERRLVAVASAAVLLGGTAGMATAAQSALPGEALYPVKRGLENAQAGLSTSSAGRGRDLLDQASGRLDEVHGLLEEEPATAALQVPHTLEMFDTQARDGADLLLSSFEKNGDPRTIVAVREFAAEELVSVEALVGEAPTSAQPGLRDAALVLQQIDASASQVCDTCTDLPALELPPMFLASAEVDRALQQVQAGKLDNSHPVIVEKQVARQVKAPTGQSAGSDGGGVAGAQSGPKAPVSGLPSAPGTPKVKVGADLDVGKVAEDLTGNLSGDVTGKVPGSVPGNLTGQLGEGLGDVVETLLPDPTTDLPR
jgi:hypothetical protein